MGDRSLDDFLDDGDDESATADGEDVTGSDAAESDSDAAVSDTADGDAGETVQTDSEAVEPATSTYSWDGDGGVCADCGERVDRRWRQGERFVCGSCKNW